MTKRIEEDSLGYLEIPEGVYYGVQTERARRNFPISSLRFSENFIKNLALIKKMAALSNKESKKITLEISGAITTSCDEIIEGKFSSEFPVDIFQTGSGTSTNMNINEVIAARGNEILTGHIRGKAPIHPNDHVNMGQSSNDVIPSAIYITCTQQVISDLIPSLILLRDTLGEKEDEFKDIYKIGRTHLQDAVTMTLGEEFGGYRAQINLGIERLESILPRLKRLPLGGTAVGTGINTTETFISDVISGVSASLGIDFSEAENHFQAQSNLDTLVELSGVLKSIGVSFYKIANDIRWLSSGPRCGIGEIILPELQPGSSIMPGKINPVICESTMMAAAKIIGNDSSITLGGLGGNFQLNTMMPLVTHCLLESIGLLTSSGKNLAERCIKGITADGKKIESMRDRSLALATRLVPYIGYDRSCEIAREAHKRGLSVYEAAIDKKILPQKTLEEIFRS